MKKFILLSIIYSFGLNAQIFNNQETVDSAKIDRIKNIEDYLFEFSSNQDEMNKRASELEQKIKSQEEKIKELENKISKHQIEFQALSKQVSDLVEILTPTDKDDKKKSKLIVREEFEKLQSSFHELKTNTETSIKTHEAGIKAVQTILIQMEKEKNRLKKK